MKPLSRSGSKLAITPGEPSGIGPDLLVTLAQSARDSCWIAIADRDLLKRAAQRLGLALEIDHDLAAPSCVAGRLTVLHTSLAQRETPGQLEPRNAAYVLETLKLATTGCLNGDFAGVVTGPVQKSLMNDAGIAFSGHTEFFCERCGVEDVLMLLIAGELRVALATTHLPLRQVPDALSAELLRRRLGLLLAGLRQSFDVAQPRILVAGLNPHAGESGHLGSEEIEIIEPVCAEFRTAGEQVMGPLPADTLFTPAMLARADAVFVMYHDQGLPVLKSHGFGAAVNVTLGLPFTRTSVDHGTALDLAGSGRADAGSLASAIALGARLSGVVRGGQ